MATRETSIPEPGPFDCNLGVLVGELSSDPRPLDLESGSVLLRYEVTVRDGDTTDTVPVVRFDPTASEASLRAGTRVALIGRGRHGQPDRGGCGPRRVGPEPQARGKAARIDLDTTGGSGRLIGGGRVPPESPVTPRGIPAPRAPVVGVW